MHLYNQPAQKAFEKDPSALHWLYLLFAANVVVEEQQIVQTKQAEVAAESVTMPENIKAAGAAAKIPAETQHLQQKARIYP